MSVQLSSGLAKQAAPQFVAETELLSDGVATWRVRGILLHPAVLSGGSIQRGPQEQSYVLRRMC